MMRIFKLAMRNVWRNKRRTLITVAATAFALAMMIIYAGLMVGFFDGMERNVIAMQTAHIQAHAPGYRDDPDLYTKIENSEEALKKLDQAGFHASSRLLGYGLVSSGPSSVGAMLIAIDPEKEALVTEIHTVLQEGTWLNKKDAKGVVVGRQMARTLGVKLGDELVFLSQAADGSLANDLYTVRGILKVIGENIDRAGMFLLDSEFREVMAFPEGVHEIAIRTGPDVDLNLAAAQVQKLLPDQEVKTWKQIQPALAQMLEQMKGTLYFLYIITYAAIGMVILNAMLMAVFERIREFGVLKAIGMSPISVLALIVCEAVIQTALAIIAGVTVGIPGSLLLEDHGINLAMFGDTASFAGVAMDTIWRSSTTAQTIIEPIIFLIVVALLAVIYPGVKAAVIKPIKAIYHR